MLGSFGLLIGRCLVLPPSPKAALLIVMWFFGTPVAVPSIDIEAAIANQYLAAGASGKVAAAEIARLNRCAASYVVPPWMEKK